MNVLRIAVMALLCTAFMASDAAADVRGMPLPGSHAVAQSTSELQASALGRVPRRKQPEEHATRRTPRPAVTGRRTADGAATLSRSPDTAATLAGSFAGPTLGDSGAYPPDSMGDVGPAQIIVMVNGRVRSYDKATGSADGVLDVATDQFFSSVMTPVSSNFTSDPHIRYDRLSQRWIAVMIDVPDSGGVSNRVLIAVSDGPVITASSTWRFFEFDEGTTGEFADYPTLGVDANALYIGTNQFSVGANPQFQGCNVYVVQKSSILGTGPIHVTAFPHVTTATGAGLYTPQGVDNADPAATTGWFAGVDNAQFGEVDLLQVLAPGSATPTLSARTTLTVPATAYPVNVPHPNGTQPLDAVDDRLYAAQIRDGHLWTAHNVGVTSAGAASSSATRTASRWYDIDLTRASPALAQSGTIFDPSSSSPNSYWMPSIAVDGEGYAAIGGSVAGAASNPDAWFATRGPADAAGAVTVPTRYTAATAVYNPPYDRWGDYSLTRVDPDDDQTLWTIQEYVAGPNAWGVRVARIRAPAPAVPAVSGSDVVAPGQSHALLTLAGDAAAGRWFDPGSGFADRLRVTAGCGITVNSATVTGVASIDLDLDTTGASGSSCDVTVVNPDGQAATAPALLTTVARPTAVDDSGYVAPASGPLDATVSVLANDTDPRGEALTAQPASAPSHGAVVLRSDGTFTYTPAAGFSGTDAFTYRAADSASVSKPATVRVSVPVPAPAAAPAAPAAVPVLLPAALASIAAVGPAPSAPRPVRCVVPRLRGRTVAGARRLLVASHCRPGRILRVRSTVVRRARVVSTRPVARATRLKGSRITLLVRR